MGSFSAGFSNKVGVERGIQVSWGADARNQQLHDAQQQLAAFCKDGRLDRAPSSEDLKLLNKIFHEMAAAARVVRQHPAENLAAQDALRQTIDKYRDKLGEYVDTKVITGGFRAKVARGDASRSDRALFEKFGAFGPSLETIMGGGHVGKTPTRAANANLDKFLAEHQTTATPAHRERLPNTMASLLNPASTPPVVPRLSPQLITALAEALALLPQGSPLSQAVRRELGAVAALQGDTALPPHLVDATYHAARLADVKPLSAPSVAGTRYNSASAEFLARVRQAKAGGDELKIRAKVAPGGRYQCGSAEIEGTILLTAGGSDCYINGFQIPLNDLSAIEVIGGGKGSKAGGSVRTPRPRRITQSGAQPPANLEPEAQQLLQAELNKDWMKYLNAAKDARGPVRLRVIDMLEKAGFKDDAICRLLDLDAKDLQIARNWGTEAFMNDYFLRIDEEQRRALRHRSAAEA